MESTPGRHTASAMIDWKDDFAPLQAAGTAMLRCMRDDEAAPDADLYRRISASGVGSHMYYSSSSSVDDGTNNASGREGITVTPTVRHVKSEPLPPLVTRKIELTRKHTFMGLLPEASLAWVSVDDELFLWPFQGQPGSLCSFRVPSGQSVITVGLARPKKGRVEHVYSFSVVSLMTIVLTMVFFFILRTIFLP